MSKDYTDEEWTRRKNLQPPEGRWVEIKPCKQGAGRNAAKQLRKKSRKKLRGLVSLAHQANVVR